MYYSSIFNIYKKDNVYFYNILKKIQLPGDKTTELYEKYIVPYTMPWTTLSYIVYGDIRYYWLLLLANDNKKLNPLFATVADTLFIIKQKYLDLIIEELSNNIESK